MTEAFQQEVYDRHYAGRDALTREQADHPLFAAFYDRLAARILDAATASSPVRVLEMGCGEGLLAAALHRVALQRGTTLHYTGSDLSSSAVAIARTHVDATFVTGDAATVAASLPQRSFDVVLAKNLLHHLDDPAAFLREAAGRAVPGGRVVAIEATRGSLQAWLFSLLAPRRERLFFVSGPRRNRDAFAAARVRVVHEEPFSWLPYELLFAIRFGLFRRMLAIRDAPAIARIDALDDRLAQRWSSAASYRIYIGAVA